LKRFALVGYGRIGRVHEAALALVGADLAIVVDPPIGRPWPDRFEGIDAVVVATPTPTHAGVVADVRRRWSGPVLVEKPLSASGSEVTALLRDPWVSGLYHAAFGAEVEWAARRLASWGRPESVEVALDDAYTPADDAESRLVGSWVDGGINALSIVHRLLDVRRLGPLGTRTDLAGYQSFAGSFHGDGGAAVTVTTRWDQPAAGKRTAVSFASGAALELDHLAMTGRLSTDDGTLESFRAGRSPARLVQHYAAMYDHLAGHERLLALDVELALHRLLVTD